LTLRWISSEQIVGEDDHFKVFANEETAERRFQENVPERVAFVYEVMGPAEKPDPFLESPGG
jgi:hypothetical protein